MNEIKIKAYGLVNITKKQYIITQTIIFIVLIAAFAVTFIYDFSASEDLYLKYLRSASAIIFVLEVLEAFFMLKKFKSKANESAD